VGIFQRFSEWLGRNWTWLRWVVAFSVLGFLFHQHWDGVRKLDWTAIHPGMLTLGFLFCLAAQVLTYLRWYLLVWAQDIPFRPQDALRLGFIGYLFNYVAPGAVGGDLIKASMIAKEQKERRLVAVATVFLDRVVGLVGLLILGAIAMLGASPLRDALEFQYVIFTFQLGAVVSLVGLFVVLLPGVSENALLRKLVGLPKVGGIFAEFINSVRLYRTRWRVLVLSVFMSLISHAGLIFSFYFCALALHGSEGIPSLLGHLQLVPPSEIAGLAPLPGGIGALEKAVEFLYGLAGALPIQGFLTAVAYRVVTIGIAILGAVWYLFARREIEDVVQAEPLETSNESPSPPEAASSAMPASRVE